MFQMSPEEQRALLATAPVKPAAAASSTEHHARAKRKRVNHHALLRRGGLGRITSGAMKISMKAYKSLS
jgi:hypothetical protein